MFVYIYVYIFEYKHWGTWRHCQHYRSRLWYPFEWGRGLSLPVLILHEYIVFILISLWIIPPPARCGGVRRQGCGGESPAHARFGLEKLWRKQRQIQRGERSCCTSTHIPPSPVDTYLFQSRHFKVRICLIFLDRPKYISSSSNYFYHLLFLCVSKWRPGR